jgi:hypothetical protein
MVPPASQPVNVAYQIVGRFAVKSLLCQWRRVLLPTHSSSSRLTSPTTDDYFEADEREHSGTFSMNGTFDSKEPPAHRFGDLQVVGKSLQ